MAGRKFARKPKGEPSHRKFLGKHSGSSGNPHNPNNSGSSGNPNNPKRISAKVSRRQFRSIYRYRLA